MTTLTGGCQCGDVRYVAEGPPEAAIVCHCDDCKRQSSSAFGFLVVLPESALRILSGKLRSILSKAESGRGKTGYFCARCGTRIYHVIEWRPGRVSLRAGTLDDPSAHPPTVHLWTDRKLPWVTIPAGVTAYPRQPEG